MSDTTKISILGTYFAVLGWIIRNFFHIIRITWFPMASIGGVIGLMIYLFLFPAFDAAPLVMPDSAVESTESQSKPLPGETNTDPSIEGGRDDTTEATSQRTDIQRLGLGNMNNFILFWIATMILGTLLFAMLIVAFTRAVLERKAPGGLLYFRLSGAEIRVAVDYWIIGISILIVMVPLMMFVVAPIMFALSPLVTEAFPTGTSDPSSPANLLPLFLTAFPIFAFFYLVVSMVVGRLGFAFPIAVDQGGLGIARSIGISDGNTLAMGFSIFLLIVSGFAVQIGVQVGLGFLIPDLITQFPQTNEFPLAATVFGYFSVALMFVVLIGVQSATMAAAFAIPYRRLMESSHQTEGDTAA